MAASIAGSSGDPLSEALVQVKTGIQTYGVFVNLPITGTNSFATNVLLSTVQFPPVFTGTNQLDGTYDPAYPRKVDPTNSQCCGTFRGIYTGRIGDYETAFSDDKYVYYTWTDGRNFCTNHNVIRHQTDIRYIRVSWPH